MKKHLKNIKDFLIENIPSIIIILVTIFITSYKLPYYIECPGSLIDTTNRISVEEEYSSKGSFNMTYVSQLRATPVFYLFAKLNNKWDIITPDDGESLLTPEEQIEYGKVLLRQTNKYAIKTAYLKAGLDVKETNSYAAVVYIDDVAKTDLKIGDYITSIDNKPVNTSDELLEIIATYNVGDKITISVINGSKRYERNATIIEYEGEPKMGILAISTFDVETNPKCSFKYNNNESGSSAGLINTLTIYDKLTKEDLTQGYKISGTGTIEDDGSIGEIAGVKYKILGAAKDKADLFLVPYGENYDEAVKTKKEYKLDIDIYPVRTFDEAVEYLKTYKKGK